MKTIGRLVRVTGLVSWLLLWPQLVNGQSWGEQQTPAQRDLSIQNVIWQPHSIDPQRGGQPSNYLTYTILNKSTVTTYHHLEVEVQLLDKQGKVVDGGMNRIFSKVAPGQFWKQDKFSVGPISPEAVSVRLAIKSALTD